MPDIEEYLQAPRDRQRFAPLGLRHPVDFTHITEVLLPEHWDIKPDRTTVNDAAFEFERSVAYQNKRLTLTDHFVSRADYVAAADTPRYADSLERARNGVSYVMFRPIKNAEPTGAFERFNWTVATIGVLVTLLWAWLAAKVYRYDPAPAPPALDADRLQGIRGWLVLAALVVVLMPLRMGYGFLENLSSYNTETWAVLTSVNGANYHPFWEPLLLFEFVVNLGMIVFATLLLVLFFQKRRSVPRVFIAVVCSSLLIQMVDLFLIRIVPAAASSVTAKDWGLLARNVIGALIWSTYFLRSKRVRATFVNVFGGSRAAQASTEPATEAS